MTAQASLFGQMEKPGGVATTPAPSYRPRPAEEFHRIKAPYGTPDKQGRYWYERFLGELEKLPDQVRKLVVALTCDSPADDLDAVRRMLNRYCSASVGEQDNFQEAKGR
jgi:hypothetical protein